mgnify:CR=1 FL=1
MTHNRIKVSPPFQLYCYIKLYRGIKFAGLTHRGKEDEKIKNNLRIYVTLLISGFVICWAPFHIFMFVKARGISGLSDDMCGAIESVVNM